MAYVGTERLIVRACVRKKTYRTMKRAAKAANRMNDTNIAHHPVYPYKCGWCPFFHIGGNR